MFQARSFMSGVKRVQNVDDPIKIIHINTITTKYK